MFHLLLNYSILICFVLDDLGVSAYLFETLWGPKVRKVYYYFSEDSLSVSIHFASFDVFAAQNFHESLLKFLMMAVYLQVHYSMDEAFYQFAKSLALEYLLVCLYHPYQYMICLRLVRF